jgi:hypothetical protein
MPTYLNPLDATCQCRVLPPGLPADCAHFFGGWTDSRIAGTVVHGNRTAGFRGLIVPVVTRILRQE